MLILFDAWGRLGGEMFVIRASVYPQDAAKRFVAVAWKRSL